LKNRKKNNDFEFFIFIFFYFFYFLQNEIQKSVWREKNMIQQKKRRAKKKQPKQSIKGKNENWKKRKSVSR